MNTLLKDKTYLSVDELISNIKSKGIKIKDEDYVKEFLKHNNYYFISGYKTPFKKKNGNYKDTVCFEDIIKLYQFDKKLKLIFAETLFDIEQNVKTVFLNNFCDRYGFKEIDLQEVNNYDLSNQYLKKVLSKLKNQIIWYGKENQAVSYYKKTYSFIPIWVLVKSLTFGLIRDLIMIQKSNAKDHVCKEIVNDKNLRVIEIQNMLELLITYRNICCHDDKLIGYIHKKVNILTTPFHKYFNLKKSKNNIYIQGKKDMFAVIIAIKYFVNDTAFNYFIDKVSNLIDNCVDNIDGMTRTELLKFMNLPSNFNDIKNL